MAEAAAADTQPQEPGRPYREGIRLPPVLYPVSCLLLLATLLYWLVVDTLDPSWWPVAFLISLPPLPFLLAPLILGIVAVARGRLKALLANLVCLLVLLFPLSGFVIPWDARQPPPGAVSLKVVTQNLSRLPLGTEAVGAMLTRSQPDIVLLQRVERDRIREELYPGGSSSGWHTAAQGEMAIFSRHPILGAQLLNMAEPPHFAPALVARVRLGKKDLILVNVDYPILFQGLSLVRRISTLPNDVDAALHERLTQTRNLLDYVDAVRRPMILAGTLNGVPRDASVRPLLYRYQDTFGLGGLGFGYTYEAVMGVSRVDYILASSHFGVAGCHILNAVVSDHSGLEAHVWLPREALMP
ncbi:MAG TPA: endonuclease/exonuclease/phosphatase family protein [Candidatus Nitrosotenuis sp.]|jgi:endonuclease/exonuclease/phosphatase (EEP) superfamily protein YafD|nr:endonuclease/exonuclease/phosphatase family protein [Candidatus Nitrosotenuis sp.]